MQRWHLLLLLGLFLDFGGLGGGSGGFTVGLGLVTGSPVGEDSESLVNLLLESGRRLDEVEKLGVVHLEKHTSDLTSELGLSPRMLAEIADKTER